MRKVMAVIIATAVLAFPFGFKQAKAEEMKAAEAPAPVVGGEVIGVTVDEIAVVAKGWSAKKKILGHNVYNDKKEKVGKVYDIIIAPDKAVSYVIIAAGGFLGMDKHDVAIPANHFNLQNGRIVLPGATKDAIKAMPAFEYAK